MKAGGNVVDFMQARSRLNYILETPVHQITYSSFPRRPYATFLSVLPCQAL